MTHKFGQHFPIKYKVLCSQNNLFNMINYKCNSMANNKHIVTPTTKTTKTMLNNVLFLCYNNQNSKHFI